jgi:anti-sigma factor RsiW
MNLDLPQDELLSAYLDGELTAQQQAEVERLLAGSPPARQLLDELRALSATLQALPRRKLGEDISQQVLRQAERQMLMGDAEAPRPAAVARESRLRRMLSRRALVWSALAVAVALVLMISDRQWRERRVALAPASARRASEPPSVQAAPGAEEAREKDLGRGDRSAGSRFFAAGAPAAAPSTDSGRGKPGAAKLAFGAAQPTDRDTAGKLAEDKAKAGGTIIGSGEIVAAKRPAAASEAPRPPQPGPPTDESGITEGIQQRSGGQVPQFADGVLVVQCDISPKAARKQAFAKLLTDNQIAWEESPAQSQVAADEKNQRYDMHYPGSGVPQRSTRDAPASEPAHTGDLELVYVEAPADRIEATLSQLTAEREKFPAVSVESVPGIESQQTFGQNNRPGEKPPQAEQLDRTLGLAAGSGGRDTNGRQLKDARQQQLNVQSAQLGRAQRIVVLGGSAGAGPAARGPSGNVLGGQFQRQRQWQAPAGPAPAASAAAPAKPAGKKPAEPLTEEKPPPAAPLSELAKSEKPSAAAEAPVAAPGEQPRRKANGAALAGATIAGQGRLEEAEKAETAGVDRLARPQAQSGLPALKQEAPQANQQLAQTQQMRRVLFVLRVVGPDAENTPARRAAEATASPAEVPAAAREWK